jgi:hypothetical protein
MGLKVQKGVTKDPVPVADYSEHLGTKPVIGTTTAEKLLKKEPVPGSHKSTSDLGHYESARIGVTITVPCEKDTLNEAYEFGSSWVSEKIEEAIAEAKG